MDTNHTVEFSGAIDAISVSYAVYVGEDEFYDNNCVNFTEGSSGLHPYEDPLSLAWEFDEGYELTTGFISLVDPLSRENIETRSMINEDGTVKTGISTDSALSDYRLLFHLNRIDEIPLPTYYDITTNSNLANSVTFSIQEAGSTTQASTFIEDTHVEIFWVANPGYEIISTTISDIDDDGSILYEDINNSDVGGISFDIHNDTSVYCEVIEVPAKTIVSGSSTIETGVTFDGLGEFHDGEETTISITAEPGFEIISISKTTYNYTNETYDFEHFNYDELATDIITAGSDDVVIQYRVEVRPTDDYLLLFYVYEDEVDVSNLTQLESSNGYYGIYEANTLVDFYHIIYLLPFYELTRIYVAHISKIVTILKNNLL